MLRLVLYVVLAIALTAPLVAETYFDVGSPWKTAVVWLGLQVALWASYPRYRWYLAQQATFTLTLLVVVNLLLSPLVPLVVEQPAPTLVHNLNERFEIPLPGFEGVQVVTTNRYGHRTNGPIDYSTKPASSLQIVAIGGSTTEEILLDDRKTWPSLLGSHLQRTLARKIEVINTALAGTRTEQQFASFRDSAAYAPDVAVFMLGINDWNRAIVRANRSALERIAASLMPWSFRQSLLYQGIATLRTLLQNDNRPKQVEPRAEEAFLVSQSGFARSVPTIDFRLSNVDESFRHWFSRIMDECRKRKILCVFTDQPIAYDQNIDPALRDRLWMTPPLQRYALKLADLRSIADLYNSWIRQTTTSEGFLFCQLADRMPPTAEFFYDDCHFTEKGAERVAELLTQCLMSYRR